MKEDLQKDLEHFNQLFKFIAIVSAFIGSFFLIFSYQATSWDQNGIYNFSGTIFAVGIGLALIIVACFSFSISFWCKIKIEELKD